ncbi:hypothetical protein ABT039_41215 [Streptomyces lasiicapitis]|uniref:Uncharacterized protein n=1 Tax=Streptomyces lasiicapitis TaxID=1923961 RepID=A0ABQ2M600_9ACTN|nr:hypothetical protein [Streptomyces lasiicapitis]GGO46323.1 hypothetical protein GCM10012286_36970 [Streptomyces lasiicapitis]
MERTKAPGSAYAVVRGDEVAHRRTWGSDGNGAPITSRTPNQTSGISEREGLERSDRGDNEPGGVERRARSLVGVPLSGPPGERHRYSAAA